MLLERAVVALMASSSPNGPYEIEERRGKNRREKSRRVEESLAVSLERRKSSILYTLILQLLTILPFLLNPSLTP